MKLKTDVIIAGGGLSGLGLAYQLKTACADLDITVVEKNTFPRPKAVAKVGESTVEIGSHYLSEHLGLKKHLQSEHLKKFGIRMFFGGEASDFSQQDELGASQTFGIPTYQIDRGDLENHLHDKLINMGVGIIDGIDIKNISLDTAVKKVSIQSCDDVKDIQSRWFFDAAGRAAIVKKEKGLAEKNHHKGNAVWFRIDRKIVIDDWSANTDWRQRCQPKGKRWLSTNHLVGPGYWVWIIPLASGVTSIGIVMDDSAFAQSNIKDEASAMRWLQKYQKRCAGAIEGAKFLDFVVARDYSYGCKQLLSSDGWALTGEAAMFTDPFYSPGSDFIAIMNCFLTGLVSADIAGKDTRFNALLYEKLFKSIYQNTLSLYAGQYGGFGDRRMMSLKLLWDYSYYWGVLSLLFFRDALRDTDLMRELSSLLMQAQAHNQGVQTLFRARAERRLVLPNRGLFMDQYKIPCLQHFNRVLMKANSGSAEELKSDLNSNLAILTKLASTVSSMLSETVTPSTSAEERDMIGDYRSLVMAS